MQKFTVAAASVKNLVGQADANIENMDRWTAIACVKGAEFILFPELNVSGYITAPVAQSIAETVPGPSTEKIIEIARKRQVILCFGIIEKEDKKPSLHMYW